MNDYVYLKSVLLDNETRGRHGIKQDAKTLRLDAVGQAGYYRPVEAIKTQKGMFYVNIIDRDNVIHGNVRRNAQLMVQCPAGNFSSFYVSDTSVKDVIVGFGNPSSDEFFKPKRRKRVDGSEKIIEKRNPFYPEHTNDGFLFLAKPDFTELEIIIVPEGRYVIQSYVKKYTDGQMRDVLTELRKAARPVYRYV